MRFWQHVSARFSWFSRLARPLRVILLLAFLNGALYFLLIPAWWHYDEPGQFEYIWLVANRPTWPKLGERDQAMRLEMARSMQRDGWYALRGYKPDFSSSKPIWIGAPQTGGKPGYYFVASLPLRLLHGTDITVQYYVVRLLSLVSYLLTVLIVWKALGDLLPEGEPLQWLVTGFVALLPAFTDIMTGVTDDVGAILLSCLWLWLSIRLVKRGFSVGRSVPWLIVLILAYFTKITVWYAFLVAPLVLLLSLLKGRLMWLPWTAIPIAVLIAALLVLQGGGAAFWYQDRSQSPPFRAKSTAAPLGDYVFQLDYSGERTVSQTGQFVSEGAIKALRGKTVTLGAWVWTKLVLAARLPVLRFETDQLHFVDSTSPMVRIGPKPTYFRTVITVPSDADYAIVLPPYIFLRGRKIQLYFDGVVLTEGAYPTGTPSFGNSSGSEGNWNGHPFQNLIENGSAEQGALRVRPAIDRLTAKWPSEIGKPSTMLSLATDWPGTSWYYAATFQTMFRTFWASVAADKFNLPGSASDVLLGLTAIGILGAFHFLWRKRKVLRWDLVLLLLVTAILVWSITSARGISSVLTSHPAFPFARYAFPAILPTALLICTGWADVLELLGSRYHLSRKALYAVPVGMMGLLSLYTLFNVEKYFHPSLVNREWLLWVVGILIVAFLLLWRRDQLRASLKQA